MLLSAGRAGGQSGVARHVAGCNRRQAAVGILPLNEHIVGKGGVDRTVALVLVVPGYRHRLARLRARWRDREGAGGHDQVGVVGQS